VLVDSVCISVLVTGMKLDLVFCCSAVLFISVPSVAAGARLYVLLYVVQWHMQRGFGVQTALSIGVSQNKNYICTKACRVVFLLCHFLVSKVLCVLNYEIMKCVIFYPQMHQISSWI